MPSVKVLRLLALDPRTNEGYSVKYGADPTQFNQYLPIAKQMVNSIEVNQNISNGTLLLQVTKIKGPFVNEAQQRERNIPATSTTVTITGSPSETVTENNAPSPKQSKLIQIQNNAFCTVHI